jgi:hypothetical protein
VNFRARQIDLLLVVLRKIYDFAMNAGQGREMGGGLCKELPPFRAVARAGWVGELGPKEEQKKPGLESLGVWMLAGHQCLKSSSNRNDHWGAWRKVSE